ncbi:MAG: hypothetical protein MI923_11090, partial [Phycisphaerales bacterium]|nr:hypothetical protein [Phycisphaerales bacterium]
LQLELGEIMAKNIAQTARCMTTLRAPSAFWGIFAELDKPKRTLSKINLTSMQVSMFQVCF